MNTEEMLKTIIEIIDRGNTAEVKRRKNDVIVLEAKRKIEYIVPSNGKE